MDGLSSLDNWEVFLILSWLASIVLLLVAVPITIGGLVWWLMRRRFPPSWFVRGCMILTIVIPVGWLSGIAVGDVMSVLDDVEIETMGRLCSSGVMGGPPRLCDDTHLCEPVPELFTERLVACNEDCEPPCPCPVEVSSAAALRLKEGEDEWLVWAQRVSVNESDPRGDIDIWIYVSGPLASPITVEQLAHNDGVFLLWDHQDGWPDAELRLIHQTGPPFPEVCAAYLENPGPVRYVFDSR